MPLARLGPGWLPRIERVLSEAPASCGLALSAPRDAGDGLARFFDLVVAGGERVDLTSAKDPDTLVDLLLADAAVLAAAELEQDDATRDDVTPAGVTRDDAPARSVIDVGSGVGAPAIPFALLRPELALTLVEPREKRAAFLRTSIGTLGRPDIQLVRSRSTEL